jgi:hypothetical protein
VTVMFVRRAKKRKTWGGGGKVLRGATCAGVEEGWGALYGLWRRIVSA